MLLQTTISIAVLAFSAMAASPGAISNSERAGNDLARDAMELRARPVVPLCGNCQSDLFIRASNPNQVIALHWFGGGGGVEMLEAADHSHPMVGGPSDTFDHQTFTPIAKVSDDFLSDAGQFRCDGPENDLCHPGERTGHCGDFHSTSCTEESDLALQTAEKLSANANIKAVVAGIKGNARLRLSENSKYVQVLNCKRGILAQLPLDPSVSAQLLHLSAE